MPESYDYGWEVGYAHRTGLPTGNVTVPTDPSEKAAFYAGMLAGEHFAIFGD